MVYDPQAKHRRPKPADEETAPVEALLGATPATAGPRPVAGPPPATPDDPPPVPSVTPAPADPPPDALLINTGLAGAVAGVVTLLLLRHLWRRRQSARIRSNEGQP